MPSSKQLLSKLLLQRLENSTILSWHTNEDGTILAYIECPSCSLVEEFITVEAAAAFGTIHRRDSLHLNKFLAALRIQLEKKN